MCISDWSSDVCSSDLAPDPGSAPHRDAGRDRRGAAETDRDGQAPAGAASGDRRRRADRDAGARSRAERGGMSRRGALKGAAELWEASFAITGDLSELTPEELPSVIRGLPDGAKAELADRW